MIFLSGGPPHQDMFDLKMDAPAEIRGEFQPISTKVPGIQICEQVGKCGIAQSVDGRAAGLDSHLAIGGAEAGIQNQGPAIEHNATRRAAEIGIAGDDGRSPGKTERPNEIVGAAERDISRTDNYERSGARNIAGVGQLRLRDGVVSAQRAACGAEGHRRIDCYRAGASHEADAPQRSAADIDRRRGSQS